MKQLNILILVFLISVLLGQTACNSNLNKNNKSGSEVSENNSSLKEETIEIVNLNDQSFDNAIKTGGCFSGFLCYMVYALQNSKPNN